MDAEKRAALKARLEEIKNRPKKRFRPPSPPPRYDEEYFRGLAWLESLALPDEGPDET